MKAIDINHIEPQEDVRITYTDKDMGYYHMNIKKNSYVNVNNKPWGIKPLNRIGHQLNKADLREFLEDHVKEANLRLSKGKDSGIDKIEVDGKLVFEPKMIAYINMPSDHIDVSKVHPQNELKIKFAKPINIDLEFNVKENKFLEIRPEKDGLIFHDTRKEPVTPDKLQSFLNMYVRSADDLLRQGKPCPIESITVDGKLVFETKMLQYGKGKSSEQAKSQDNSKAVSKENVPTKIYRIGRLDTQDRVNGWELIEAPTEGKALNFASRLFNQEENNERPYSFVSNYVPVVLGKYNNREELGYGWKDITPIKADDKPMPYEIELQKLKAKDTKLEKGQKSNEGKGNKPHKRGLRPKREGRACER